MSAPVYGQFGCIYPGPHVDNDGNFDSRVWFSLPIELNTERGVLVYLVFPYGGKDKEITEVEVEAT